MKFFLVIFQATTPSHLHVRHVTYRFQSSRHSVSTGHKYCCLKVQWKCTMTITVTGPVAVMQIHIIRRSGRTTCVQYWPNYLRSEMGPWAMAKWRQSATIRSRTCTGWVPDELRCDATDYVQRASEDRSFVAFSGTVRDARREISNAYAALRPRIAKSPCDRASAGEKYTPVNRVFVSFHLQDVRLTAPAAISLESRRLMSLDAGRGRRRRRTADRRVTARQLRRRRIRWRSLTMRLLMMIDAAAAAERSCSGRCAGGCRVLMMRSAAATAACAGSGPIAVGYSGCGRRYRCSAMTAAFCRLLQTGGCCSCCGRSFAVADAAAAAARRRPSELRLLLLLVMLVVDCGRRLVSSAAHGAAVLLLMLHRLHGQSIAVLMATEAAETCGKLFTTLKPFRVMNAQLRIRTHTDRH